MFYVLCFIFVKNNCVNNDLEKSPTTNILF